MAEFKLVIGDPKTGKSTQIVVSEDNADKLNGKKIGDKIIKEHFDMLEKRTDAPDSHSHVGIWTSFFVCKIGYDEGYEDYCFKNAEDALYFKLMWAEEAERRA